MIPFLPMMNGIEHRTIVAIPANTNKPVNFSIVVPNEPEEEVEFSIISYVEVLIVTGSNSSRCVDNTLLDGRWTSGLCVGR
jgi:hypothetical protein